MIWMALLAMAAQGPAPADGAKLYRAYCAVAYCHGPEGAAGRAPQLADRSWLPARLFGRIADGIPDSAMPAFKNQLKTDEIEAVVRYILSLGREGPEEEASKERPPSVPPEAAPGRALFFDAARLGACGACHEIGGWGVPIGANLAKASPERLRDLRSVAASRVMTARPVDGSPSFPALVIEETAQRIVAYDLGSPLPVRREFRAGRVNLEKGSSWQHREATRLYTHAELDAIARYLRWAAAK